MAGTGRQAPAAVVRVYARALASLAFADKEEDDWHKALQILAAAAQSPGWQQLLSTPGHTRSQRAQLLVELAGDALSDKAVQLVRLLATYGRLGSVKAILQAFQQQMDLLHRRRRVEVQSARKLDDDERTELEAVLTRRFGENGTWSLEWTYQTRPELIEGVVALCADQRLDASLLGQIRQLGAALTSP